MQKNKKTLRVDPEKNAPQMNRQKERQMDRQTGLTLQDPFHKDGGLITFFKNLRIKFSYII